MVPAPRWPTRSPVGRREGMKAPTKSAYALDRRRRGVIATVLPGEEVRDDHRGGVVARHRIWVREPFGREIVSLKEAKDLSVTVNLHDWPSRTMAACHPRLASFEVNALHAFGRPRLERCHPLHLDVIGLLEVGAEGRQDGGHGASQFGSRPSNPRTRSWSGAFSGTATTGPYQPALRCQPNASSNFFGSPGPHSNSTSSGAIVGS